METFQFIARGILQAVPSHTYSDAFDFAVPKPAQSKSYIINQSNTLIYLCRDDNKGWIIADVWKVGRESGCKGKWRYF